MLNWFGSSLQIINGKLIKITKYRYNNIYNSLNPISRTNLQSSNSNEKRTSIRRQQNIQTEIKILSILLGIIDIKIREGGCIKNSLDDLKEY